MRKQCLASSACDQQEGGSGRGRSRKHAGEKKGEVSQRPFRSHAIVYLSLTAEVQEGDWEKAAFTDLERCVAKYYFREDSGSTQMVDFPRGKLPCDKKILMLRGEGTSLSN